MLAITLDREVLYREVWKRPILKVAKDYGLSDVGLAKACARLRVPTPPRGYWAKLEAGQKPRIPPLPPTKGRVSEEIGVRTRQPAPDVELIPEPTIVVADNLRGVHSLIKATQEELSAARGDTYGRLYRRDSRGMALRVSKESLPRALRVVNALIRGLEDLGFSVEVGKTWNRQENWAVILGERVPFKMRERSNQKGTARHLVGWSSRTLGYSPSGQFELSIDHYGRTGGVKCVQDRSAEKPIEKELGRFIVGLHACAQVMRQARLEREQAERQREITRREQERRARLEAYQAWLAKHLARQAAAHREAEMIREFLASLKGRDGRLGEDGSSSEWLKWAIQEADRLDPLTNEEPIAQPLVPPESWSPDEKTVTRWDEL